ncbi:putative dimethylaniline monooxygenase [Erysiphe necator]|uniref:Putative dimethylaniline monooxygenase n=1 Tax=Uncinula necator TaxID=52586 RepID=A0A0B1PDZ7_UNCNE|nr:putative dimethylaniline monooxygenase [Erysiphe necator]
MVSSKQLTTFSDYRYPIGTPDFLSTEEYCRYLEKYCKHFRLNPFIQLESRVLRVQRDDTRGPGHIVHILHAGEVSQWPCDAIAICSGLHVIPNIPEIPGLSNIPQNFHSSEFKNSRQFGEGKNILILGSGETGMDIAYLAIKSRTKSVTLSHRDGFFCAPKRAPETNFFGIAPCPIPRGNVPYDVGAASLFDTSYVHPILRNSFIPWEYYDLFAKFTTWLVSGTKAGLDQWIGEISPERFHVSKIFFNKSTRAIPYISAQYRKPSVLNSLRSFIATVPIPTSTQGRQIDLAPWPKKIDKSGVVEFMENGRPEAKSFKNKNLKPDIVILATGYKQCFSFLDDDYPCASDANIRNIWREGCETTSPKSRITYGVDHESYAYQLALDIGAAPSFTQVLLLGWKTTVSWALSANVNPKFRLVGPWQWNGAKEIMEGEVWDTITRRRFFFGKQVLAHYSPLLLKFTFQGGN